MALSHELLSQFAKIVNNKPKTSTATTIYGTVVKDDSGTYVQPDGSDQLIPLDVTSTEANVEDRVSVMLKDHTATVTGNMTAPAVSTTTVKYMEQVLTGRLEADEAYIKKLDADKIDTAELEAAEARIAELYAEKATVEQLSADVVEVTELTAKKLDAEVANLTYATIENLEATDVKVGTLEAAHGEFASATVEQLKAQNAEIDNLKAKDAEIKNVVAENLEATNAEIDNLKAKDADLEELVADKASIEDLDATKAEIKNLGAKYASIDFANINEAAVEKIFADSGIIKDMVVSNGAITGELVGVTIKGDLIEGNTVKADKLIVKGSDGLYYKLNVEGGATTTEEVSVDDLQNGLHGSVIIAKSITAEKVRVDDLVAFDATIGGFNITDRSLYSGVKSNVDNTTRGIYMDVEGQLNVGDGNNFLKYYCPQIADITIEDGVLKATAKKAGTVSASISDGVLKVEPGPIAADIPNPYILNGVLFCRGEQSRLEIAADYLYFGGSGQKKDVGTAITEATDTVNASMTEQDANVVETCKGLLEEALKHYTKLNGDEDESGFNEFKDNIEQALELLSGQTEEKINKAQADLDAAKQELQEQLNTFKKYFTFDPYGDGLTIGKEGSPNKVVIDNDDISIMVNDDAVQRFDSDGNALTPDLTISRQLKLLGISITMDTAGRVNGEFVGAVDITFTQQPEAEITYNTATTYGIELTWVANSTPTTSLTYHFEERCHEGGYDPTREWTNIDCQQDNLTDGVLSRSFAATFIYEYRCIAEAYDGSYAVSDICRINVIADYS